MQSGEPSMHSSAQDVDMELGCVGQGRYVVRIGGHYLITLSAESNESGVDCINET